MTDEFDSMFAPEEESAAPTTSGKTWKILVVDDEKDIHAAIDLALDDIAIEGRSVELLHAYSAQQARGIISDFEEIALVLLDVVMEAQDAGLQFVQHIREESNNHRIQIALITGQPGYAPEKEVVERYEINDYRLKSDLTAEAIYTLVFSSIRAFSSLLKLHQYRISLEQQVEERTRELSLKTEHLDLAKRLAEISSQAKSRILGNISHEFKTPLNAILGFTQLLQRTPEIPPHIQESIHSINLAGRALHQRIDILLEAGRIDRLDIKINKYPFNLGDLLSQLQQFGDKITAEQGLKFSLVGLNVCPRDLITDPIKLKRIVECLIDNAAQFSEVGEIKIRLYRTRNLGESRLIIEVEDSGPGIIISDQQRIFEPFIQGDLGIKAGSGTGLGLAIGRAYAEALDGKLIISETGPEGSCFMLEIPIEEVGEVKSDWDGNTFEQSTPLNPDKSVPRELLTRLRRAALNLDGTTVKEIIAKIEIHDRPLAARLYRMARGFHYDEIATLISC